MPDKITLKQSELLVLARDCALRLRERLDNREIAGNRLRIYGIPRGGVEAAKYVAHTYKMAFPREEEPILVDELGQANCIVDDLFDSGATIEKTLARKSLPWEVLINKSTCSKFGNVWIVFPWEVENGEADGPVDAIQRLLQFIGEDVDREGLQDTPKRVLKAWREMTEGYNQDPADVMTVFEDGACDEMVISKDIPFYSMCEHHMLPFHGKAHIAYLPNKKIIGLSKLTRLLDIFARRLQVQERLTTEVTDALDKHLEPLGAACIIESAHMCMSCRGVRRSGSTMVTSSLTGRFRDQSVRQELMTLIKN